MKDLPVAAQDNSTSPGLRLVVVTTFFPNAAMPQRTLFVRNLVSAMRARCEVIGVIAPVPYSPPFPVTRAWKAKRSVPAVESIDGLSIVHPRFIAIPGLQFLNGLTYGARVVVKLWRMKQKHGSFLVHAHCAYPDGVGAALAARILDLPYVITAHGSDLNVYAQIRTLRPQIAWALRGAAGIVAVSQALRDKVFRLLSEQRTTQTAHIPCAGFDPRIFSAPSDPRDATRGREVIFVGHLVPIKGIPFLIEAWQQLAARGCIDNRDRLVIVGDGPERAALERLADQLGVRGTVEFTGVQAPPDVAKRVSAARVLCLPSINEGTPNVVVEALACGVPVVASRVGGIPDLVSDGMNGWLIQPGNVEQLSEALSTALSQRWSQPEIRRSVEHLTWDSLALRNVAFMSQSTRLLA